MSVIRKILLVDDDPGLRQLIRLTLGEGFRFYEAANGVEAVQMAGVERPDIVFLDLDMPGMNGYEASRRIKAESTTDSPFIVILTGHDSNPDLIRATGADALMLKPFSPVALLRIVDQFLGNDL